MAAPQKKKSQIKNAREVYWAWQLGERHDATLACWTDGTTIWSYETALMVKAPSVNKVVLNAGYVTRYTTPYQDALKKLAALKSAVVIVHNGATATVPGHLLLTAGLAANGEEAEAAMEIASSTPVESVEPKAEPKRKKEAAKLYDFNPELGF